LIHAPLYYRLVAAAAWPLVAAGLEPVTAVIAAGRFLSLVGTGILFFAVFRIAVVRTTGSRAGWLGVLLLASCALFGALAVMVRPDTLGVALQTLGCWLVFRQVEASDPHARPTGLTLAAACFGLAFCMKQQNIAVPAICVGWLILSAARRRVRPRDLFAPAMTAILVVGGDLALENLLTRGRMWQSVFVYPSGPFRAINFAGWQHVISVFDICLRRTAGLILIIPAALVALRGRAGAGSLDRRLCSLLAVEVAMLVPLCLFNAGAASNYALQAVVLAAILAARLLDRALNTLSAPSIQQVLPRAVPLVAAIALIALSDVHWILQCQALRRNEQLTVASIERDTRCTLVPAEARYFVARQHLNRTHGRAELIHDDWLYGAFERIGAAEPRERWLRSSLIEGPILQVVAPGGSEHVPGIRDSLPELGYSRIARHGDLTVWQRLE
jgi:4-amino-4-deoxy-L-arabinose transferase-like glycosyltransferase